MSSRLQIDTISDFSVPLINSVSLPSLTCFCCNYDGIWQNIWRNIWRNIWPGVEYWLHTASFFCTLAAYFIWRHVSAKEGSGAGERDNKKDDDTIVINLPLCNNNKATKYLNYRLMCPFLACRNLQEANVCTQRVWRELRWLLPPISLLSVLFFSFSLSSSFLPSMEAFSLSLFLSLSFCLITTHNTYFLLQLYIIVCEQITTIRCTHNGGSKWMWVWRCIIRYTAMYSLMFI